MRNKALFIYAAIALTGCITRNKCLQKFPPEIKDSVYTNETKQYYSKLVSIPGDRVEAIVAIPCPDLTISKTVKSESGRTKATIQADKGVLRVDCETDSLMHRIDSLETITRTTNRIKTVIVQGPDVIKFKVPPWCWWLLAANIAVLLFVFRNPLISLIKKFIK